MTISKHTLLQRIPDLQISLEGDVVRLRSGSLEALSRPQALSILEIFSSPKTLEQGLGELQAMAASAEAFVRRSQIVMNLAGLGILRSPDAVSEPLRSHAGRFSSPEVHIRMLNDRARTMAFKQALDAVVGPEDVVLDIGTGTGVLAALAARAGARKVYAVERSRNFAKLARRFFEANDLASRITLIQGDSTEIELPERADILVSEIIGNDPLDEGILSTFTDARKRLLNPEARLIPNTLQIHALPLELSGDIIQRSVFTPRLIERWRSDYDLDFEVYVRQRDSHRPSTRLNAYALRNHRRLAEPVRLWNIDLSSQSPVLDPCSCSFEAGSEGWINGIAILFEIDMAPGQRFSILPNHVTARNSWASHVDLVDPPIRVQTGQRFRINAAPEGRSSQRVLIEPEACE